MSALVAIDISIGFAEMAAPPFTGTKATEMAIIMASIMRAIGMRSTTIGRWSTGQRRRVWKARHNAFVTMFPLKQARAAGIVRPRIILNILLPPVLQPPEQQEQEEPAKTRHFAF
jgi:hypothetical protein